MTQEQKAAAWDALMLQMEDDTKSVVLANIANMRRMFWSQGEWHTNAAQSRNGSYTMLVYDGPDPLAALEALTK